MPMPWMMKSVRQLVASMSGPPTTTPTAGDAASTALHTPATDVRSSSGKAFIMIASADGPVDDEKAWVTMRAPMRKPALGEAAVTNDMTAAAGESDEVHAPVAVEVAELPRHRGERPRRRAAARR